MNSRHMKTNILLAMAAIAWAIVAIVSLITGKRYPAFVDFVKEAAQRINNYTRQ